jgi:hypothetical protein
MVPSSQATVSEALNDSQKAVRLERESGMIQRQKDTAHQLAV